MLFIHRDSSGSHVSSDDETEDEFPEDIRGRSFSKVALRKPALDKLNSASIRLSSPHYSSGDSTAGPSARTAVNPRRASFTRARSPNTLRPGTNLKPPSKDLRHTSPSISRSSRNKPALPYTFSQPCLKYAYPFSLHLTCGLSAWISGGQEKYLFSLARFCSPP
ncbi:hypothetical protein BD779DRAFT_568324 [Infundibulicybe gibba]|nr:hypothetical protein BD779DRAFT_568324 [Infundibulicybe gibba]